MASLLPGLLTLGTGSFLSSLENWENEPVTPCVHTRARAHTHEHLPAAASVKGKFRMCPLWKDPRLPATSCTPEPQDTTRPLGAPHLCPALFSQQSSRRGPAGGPLRGSQATYLMAFPGLTIFKTIQSQMEPPRLAFRLRRSPCLKHDI